MFRAISNGMPKHLVKTLTRAKFEALAHNLIQACLEPCKNAMRDAGLSNADIDEVILVGGSTRIPAVQKLVEDFFGKVFWCSCLLHFHSGFRLIDELLFGVNS